MTDESNAQEQARLQYESICEMVAALECDYERLQELKEERNDFSLDRMEDVDCNRACAEHEWGLENPDDAAELEELISDAGDCESREEAEQRIQEDALEVCVRSGWYDPCRQSGEVDEPEEFYILLCTGGPAVRIRGELDRGEPTRAWIEYQDWFEPWKQYFDTDQATLLVYCRCFYFGE